MSNRPNLNVDVTDPTVLKNAAAANDKAKTTGKHIVKISQASLSYTNNGASKIQLVLETEGGKHWKLPEMFITAGEEKEFADTFYRAVVNNLLILTGSSGAVGQTKLKVAKFVNGDRIEEEEIFDSYNDLVGKKVGVVIKHYQKYPESLAINGYTNRPIPEKLSNPEGYEAAKKMTSTIWMPNYDKEAKPVFDAILFFDPETGKTLKELQDDECTEATEVNAKLETLKKHNSGAVKLDAKQWDALRMKKLKANLKKAGEDFNKAAFIVSSDASIDEVSNTEVNYEESYDDAE
jgi:hypothetical protein